MRGESTAKQPGMTRVPRSPSHTLRSTLASWLPLVPWRLILLLALAACGDTGEIDSEDYGNLLASPEGLVIVRDEHPTGWTRPDCFGCHNVNNIHNVNRTGLPDDVADLESVRAIVRNQGEASCALCHGDNGVEP
jgi:hypothetical protein